MKYLLIAALFFCSCKEKKSLPDRIIRIDTVFINNNDSLLQLNQEHLFAIEIQRKQIDSISKKLFIANYKIERVKYYLSICLRNPKQDKFLKGWVKRAVE